MIGRNELRRTVSFSLLTIKEILTLPVPSRYSPVPMLRSSRIRFVRNTLAVRLWARTIVLENGECLAVQR